MIETVKPECVLAFFMENRLVKNWIYLFIYYVSFVFLTDMDFFFRVPGISPGEDPIAVLGC